jgi:hypothetical protein
MGDSILCWLSLATTSGSSARKTGTLYKLTSTVTVTASKQIKRSYNIHFDYKFKFAFHPFALSFRLMVSRTFYKNLVDNH